MKGTGFIFFEYNLKSYNERKWNFRKEKKKKKEKTNNIKDT